MDRLPVVAGQFYEKDSKKLIEQIKSCFLSDFGPKSLPKKDSKDYFAAIVPHAGYIYSGPAAAHVYKEIGEMKKVDTFIIIGTNHSGLGPSVSVYPSGRWITPLGDVEVDDVFAKEIVETSKFAEFDTQAHLHEHSIEVQLPFLQFLFKDFKFVPIVFRGDDVLEEARDLADTIYNVSKKLKKNVFVIASSDFTHYGIAYGFIPFFGSSDEIKKKLYALDKKAIEEIINLHEMNFLRYVHSLNLTICGFAPIIATIFYAKKFVKKGKLLKYYCSGDISGDYENCVGYGAIIF
ncbi:MAG: AmmeMemoRadiSam system protein B [Nanoarchaeota archaeon]|nr:AmmeMemoRadiSam system protein B [Nanoarchaeota archaeon]